MGCVLCTNRRSKSTDRRSKSTDGRNNTHESTNNITNNTESVINVEEVRSDGGRVNKNDVVQKRIAEGRRLKKEYSLNAAPTWPDWLSNVAGDVIADWTPRRANSFEKIDKELKERIERVKEKSWKDGNFSSESEFSDEMMAIRKEFVTIHGEMVLLKNYSSLNFAGIIKILKKYDKRTGGLLRVHFTQLTLLQPFFTTEPLTRLVHECEENLELLFPLEAEVVESSSKPDDADNTITTSVEVETSDVYRRTIDAMRTIKGLKKESSTSNPLSFASIFGNQDHDTGAITNGDSPTNSSSSFHNEIRTGSG